MPEGGPDLTAEQARVHGDLPFVWAVADLVMERDRRARWLLHWLLGTTCVHSAEVFELREPILRVRHGGDGVWHLLGASDLDRGTARTGHLHHAVDEDQSLLDVLDLPPGGSAARTDVGSPWDSRG